MELNVIKNTKRNLVFGFINRAVALLCPFLSRTVFQIVLGSEYLGLNSLFSSILTVLNLSELGVGSAIVYSMYKPVAEDDTEKVNALLNFYKRIYEIIGVFILVAGIVLIPFLPYLISGSYPQEVNITIVYLIYLINTVLSYFMFAYMSSLTVVYQRDDINSRTNTIVILLSHGFQIAILLILKDYYLSLLMMPLFTVVNNLRIYFIVHRMFPQYHPEGSLTKEVLSDIKVRVSGAFLSKVCQVTRNSLDSICISMFLGLTMTAIYNNYYCILNSITHILAIVSTSLQGGVGNHVVTRSKEENYKELKKLDFVYMWVSCWCTICLVCLFQPFMKIWMGEDMMFSFIVVILFSLYFYELKMGDMRGIYATTNGLWWHHRYRSICGAVGNIILNVVLGMYFGVYGIIIATVITLFFFNFIWGSRITFKHYFGLDKIKDYFKYHLKYFISMIVLCAITYLCCMLLPIQNSFLVFIVRGIICVIVPNIIWILMYHHTGEFSYALSILKRS